MSAIKKSSLLSKESIIIMVLVIFYSVGIVGLLLPSTRDSFLPLSFFNLLLSFTLLILARKKSLLLFLLFPAFLVAFQDLAVLLPVVFLLLDLLHRLDPFADGRAEFFGTVGRSRGFLGHQGKGGDNDTGNQSGKAHGV